MEACDVCINLQLNTRGYLCPQLLSAPIASEPQVRRHNCECGRQPFQIVLVESPTHVVASSVRVLLRVRECMTRHTNAYHGNELIYIDRVRPVDAHSDLRSLGPPALVRMLRALRPVRAEQTL